MSPSPSLRRALSVGVAVAASLTFASPASAAGPLRSVNFDVDGVQTGALEPLAVSSDGREVLTRYEPFDYRAPHQELTYQLMVRDLVTQKTTPILLPGFDGNTFLQAASADLGTFIYGTPADLSPKDTNGIADSYLYDRATGKTTLLTRDEAGNAIGADFLAPVGGGPAALHEFGSIAISGDGKVAQFAVGTLRPSGKGRDVALWRYDVPGDRLTKVADEPGVIGPNLDDAGRVTVTASQVVVGDRRIALPSDVFGSAPVAVVSPSGNVVALRADSLSGDDVYTLDTRTGDSHKISVPAGIKGSALTWLLSAVGDDGSITIQSLYDSAKLPQFRVGRVDPSGNVTQLGVDMPLTPETTNWNGVVSANGAFAATALQAQALGTTPLPGTEPASAPGNLAPYVQHFAAYCQFRFGPLHIYSKPYLKLADTPRGGDLRFASKAAITVTDTASGKVRAQFTLAPGQARNLNTGASGRYTITSALTFKDGSTGNATDVIGDLGTPSCQFAPGF